MADDTNDTTPGADPGVLKTGADGSLPELHGRRAWVWMQDSEEGGGGRFDVLSHRIDVWLRRGARVVPNYPLHFGPSGRLARPRADLAQPAGGEASEASAEGTPQLADPTLAMPASALGAVEPADERQPDTSADADQAADDTDQAAGDPAAADITKTRKGGRTR